MFDLLIDLAKLAVKMSTPSPTDVIMKQKQVLEEFNQKMKKEKGDGWSLEQPSPPPPPQQHTEPQLQPEEVTDDPVDMVNRAFELLKKAREKTSCPVVRDTIDELLLTMEERLANRISLSTSGKILNKITEVLEEEGVEDWDSLSREEKKRIINKIKASM